MVELLSNQTLTAYLFVYLNKKQSSIANYQTNKTNNLNTNIDAINKITLEVLHANSLHSFASNRKA
jgi:hypothetical protein